MNAKITFVILSPFVTDKPPLAIENAPPTRSRMMLNIDHPFVLFLL